MMRKILVNVAVLSSLTGAENAVAQLPPFADFVREYGRKYSGEAEYKTRAALYHQRKLNGDRHNANQNRLWTVGVNSHWDWTEEEVEESYGVRMGWDLDDTTDAEDVADSDEGPLHLVEKADRMQYRGAHSDRFDSPTAFEKELPAQKDWSYLKAWKNTLRDQGRCGSCWAVAASNLLTAHSEIHTNSPRTFSAQDIVSCAPNEKKCGGEGGCKGATIAIALDWVLHNGCATAEEKPYFSGSLRDAGTCPRHSTSGSVKEHKFKKHAFRLQAKGEPSNDFGMKSWVRFPENKYEPILRALAETGPVGVSIAPAGWLDYKSGIYDRCGKDVVNSHAVVLIAYGFDGGTKYWVAQNSWGTDWGENGRIRILRRGEKGDEAWCGVNNNPLAGTGCPGGSSEVTVCGSCGMLYYATQPIFA